jgi:hypothetical protein
MLRSPAVLILGIFLVFVVAMGHKSHPPIAPVTPEVVPNSLIPNDWRNVPQAPGICDLAPEYRQKNWGGGSCVHASTVSAFRWPGSIDPAMMASAQKWRDTYSGGESPNPHKRKLDDSGVPYVMTSDGDETLLEWAVTTRRLVWIGYKPGHCINLLGRIEQNGSRYAVLLDNNHTSEYELVEWNTFLDKWKNRYGGWAGAPVLDPPPPVPVS